MSEKCVTMWQKFLGYSLKNIQNDVHSKIVLGHDILPYFLLGMVKAFVMPAYPECLVRFYETLNP